MKIDIITNKLSDIGVKSTQCNIGVYASLENVENGTARRIDRQTERRLMDYLKRSHRRWEYRGYYTSILIYAD